MPEGEGRLSKFDAFHRPLPGARILLGNLVFPALPGLSGRAGKRGIQAEPGYQDFDSLGVAPGYINIAPVGRLPT